MMLALGAAGLAGVGGLLAWGTYEPNAPVFGPVVHRGARDAIYLTFDDGPNPKATPAILDVLTREAATGAFFMVGRHARAWPDVSRAVAQTGSLIGNHTDTHVKLHLRSLSRIRSELAAAHETLSQLTGTAPVAFRAPHGYRSPLVPRAASELGYRTFGWTFGVWDSARPPAEVIRARVRRRLRPGAIVLLHDGDGYDPAGDRMQTARALPGIIRDVRDAGFQLRSLSELLA
jgi:peptidoglycan/xylan/chitin deacetylase (PgdA/CDA1 family)